ncbi:unnamed protein product [Symbiodinium sp. CCMP2592]|nr:unnamed protein product [Symbiodinium sp. CCMP2592]
MERYPVLLEGSDDGVPEACKAWQTPKCAPVVAMGSQPSCCAGQEDVQVENVTSLQHQVSEGGSEEGKDADGGIQLSNMSIDFRHMTTTSALTIEADLLRGISLAKTLRNLGRLWRTSPADLKESDRASLWQKSGRVERLDIFISHTWRTSGRVKSLALLLHSGWPVILLVYLLAAAAAVLFSVLEVLPLPFHRPEHFLAAEYQVARGVWVTLFTVVAMPIGLAISPYLRLRADPCCFLDVACIHQADLELQRKGVYGLGGFLAASREMHILWSPPYLDRLWCVFEIAAFRKANPEGKVVVRPLFVEIQALWWLLGYHIAGCITAVWLNVDLPWGGISYLVASSPFIFICHRNRKHMREKRELFQHLQHFRLEDAKCRMASDREFILASIKQWYGSEEAFVEYVRGPLQQELLESGADIPLSYCLLMVLAFVSLSLDTKTGVIIARVPLSPQLPHLMAHDIGYICLWFMLGLKISWRLTERFAAATSNRLLDFAVSFLLYLMGFLGWSWVGGELMLVALTSLWLSIAWILAMIAILTAIHFRLFTRAPPQQLPQQPSLPQQLPPVPPQQAEDGRT